MRAPWYPGAARVDGPAGRTSGPPQRKYGAVYHSMVGRVRPAQTAVSWHFSIFKTGRIEQHYRADAWCWHSGDRDDPPGEISNNRDLIGIEHEGGPLGNTREPLTPAQVASDIRLTAWLLAEGHIGNLNRTGPKRGLWEHNEIRSTACPSGRIVWVPIIAGVKLLQEDAFMAVLLKVTGQGTRVWVHSGGTLTRVQNAPAMARLRAHGIVSKSPIKVISASQFRALQTDLGLI